MPIQTWTAGQQLTAAELTTVTNMLPAPQVATANVASAVPGTLYRCQPGSGSITITLPAPTLGNAIGMMLDSATGSCVLTHNATELIYGAGIVTSGARGAVSVTLTGADSSLVVLADGSNWHVLYQFPVPNVFRTSATAATGQNDSNGVNAILTFDTATYDPNNNFSAAAHTYTCPASGVYLVDGSFTSADFTAGDRMLYVYKNGAVFRQLSRMNTSSGNCVPGGATTVTCATGDTLSLYYSTPGTTAGAVQGNYFDVTFLTP